MLKDKKTGFIGGGNMAEAIIKGLLAGGVPAADLTVSEPSPERRGDLSQRYGIRTISDNVELCTTCDTIILAVKPQVSNTVFDAVAPAIGNEKLVISIMAGIRTAAIEGGLNQGTRVVRVMPNTPALVLAAASALCRGANATDDDVALSRHIFELIGTACVVDEKYMDAVTGLSGSGPAYVLTFIEALADAGLKQGLTREAATALAAQTVLGTAKLLLETREHPAVLKGNVTSPGGTTIAGLCALEQKAFRAAVMDAVEAATVRSTELGAR